MAARMAVSGALGILVTLAEGESRLLPMAFVFRDDAWLGSAPVEHAEHLHLCEGRKADILFLDQDPPIVHGLLRCGVWDSERLVVRIEVPQVPHHPHIRREAA